MEAYPHNRMFNDIVFEGRNKHYGAYYLRHLHNRNMVIAMFGAITITLLAVNSPYILKLIKGFFPQPVAEEVVITPVILEAPPSIAIVPPPVERPAAANSQPQHEQIAFVTPNVVDEDEFINEVAPPEIGELENTTIGTQNVQGEPGLADPYPVDTFSSTGIISEPVVSDVPFVYVEQMPEFPGGEAMLFRYISGQVRYPVIARETGIEGRVIIQFVVSDKGEIQKATVVKGIGGGCDQEALRVIKSMPVWIPGKHNGRHVPVTFTLPIVFDLK